MTIPSWTMVALVVFQLGQAPLWTGMTMSPVLYTYPLATIFMGFIGGRRHTLWTAGLLSIIALGFIVLDTGDAIAAGPQLPGITMIVLVWCTVTAAMLAIYTDHQQHQFMRQIQNELTERIAAQEVAEQANSAKDGFMAYLSHEIRNPLSVIMASVDMMTDPRLSHRREQYLASMQSASHGLVGLLDDVMDFSSLEQNRLELRNAPFDVGHLLEELYREFEHQTQSKELELNLQILPNVWIDTDRLRLKQVLSNLLSNAIKFTEQGEISIDMTLKTIEDSDHVCISIVDTGRGISESQLDRIFDPFEREGSKDVPGIGLGLAICQGIIGRMGSEIVVHSRIGRGSMFSFELSCCEPMIEAFPTTPSVQIVSFEDVRVLVVEDNRDIASLYADHCEGMGCQVTTSYDGASGLDLARTWKPNVILLDLDLPEVSGQKIIEELQREQMPVQIIVITGSTAPLQDLDVFKSLHKPVSLHTVHQVLEEVVLVS
jgi:signal transduction histidine kinase/CheY-like chemotaxis protein